MKKLSLSDWANIAEIFAAFAVIFSLIFVGVELQRNTAASQAATREAINQKDLEFLSLRLNSEILAEAHAKLENGQELSPLEISQLINQEYVNFVSFEHSFYQYRMGTLVEDEWRRHENFVRSQIQTFLYSQIMWSRKGQDFTPEFRSLVEEFASQATNNQ